MASNIDWEFLNLSHPFDAATSQHRRKVRGHATKRHHEKMIGNVANKHPSRRQAFYTTRTEHGDHGSARETKLRACVAASPSRHISSPQFPKDGYCDPNFGDSKDPHSPIQRAHVRTHNYHYRKDLTSIYPESWHGMIHVLLVRPTSLPNNGPLLMCVGLLCRACICWYTEQKQL
jgi:hypothetical protein